MSFRNRWSSSTSSRMNDFNGGAELLRRLAVDSYLAAKSGCCNLSRADDLRRFTAHQTARAKSPL